MQEFPSHKVYVSSAGFPSTVSRKLAVRISRKSAREESRRRRHSSSRPHTFFLPLSAPRARRGIICPNFPNFLTSPPPPRLPRLCAVLFELSFSGMEFSSSSSSSFFSWHRPQKASFPPLPFSSVELSCIFPRPPPPHLFLGGVGVGGKGGEILPFCTLAIF